MLKPRYKTVLLATTSEWGDLTGTYMGPVNHMRVNYTPLPLAGAIRFFFYLALAYPLLSVHNKSWTYRPCSTSNFHAVSSTRSKSKSRTLT